MGSVWNLNGNFFIWIDYSDLTSRDITGIFWARVGKSCPNIRTIQVSEITYDNLES